MQNQTDISIPKPDILKLSLWIQERIWCSTLLYGNDWKMVPIPWHRRSCRFFFKYFKFTRTHNSTIQKQKILKYNAGALLNDLSKAFDCINYQLIIAKQKAYGFDTDVLKFIYSNLRRNKLNSPYSSFAEYLSAVSQGSILGPLLFNAYICDLVMVLMI